MTLIIIIDNGFSAEIVNFHHFDTQTNPIACTPHIVLDSVALFMVDLGSVGPSELLFFFRGEMLRFARDCEYYRFSYVA